MAKILLLAPYWHDGQHVGRRRMAAMRRWLMADGHEVRVVAAGVSGSGDDGILDVADPAGLGGDVRSMGTQRPFAGLRRLWRELQFLPDEGIAWARAVARNREVLRLASDCRLILSSSPPESTHLAALAISKATRVPHLCDLQDGWIDEPLRPALQRFAFRRWQEGRLEARVFQNSRMLLVTSSVWERRLRARYPDLVDRVHTLPLGVATDAPVSLAADGAAQRGSLRLLHAGSFTMSHNARRMEYLLRPLLAASPPKDSQPRRIELLGTLHPRESKELPGWQKKFRKTGWELSERSAMPREEFLRELPRYDGLLLLSASAGAVPSKLYEYLQTGLPILAVCTPESAVAEIARAQPAMETVAMGKSGGQEEPVGRFLQTCAEARRFAPPVEYADERLAAQFLAWVRPFLSGG